MIGLVEDDRSGLRAMDDCRHDATVYLGSGGNVVYQVCEECGATIVSQGGRRFFVRPPPAAQPRPA